jgi:hypothetical protein
MSSTKKYKCAGNNSWINFLYVCDKSVPINMGGVEMFKTQFKDPSQFPDSITLEVAVPPGTNAAALHALFGTLKCVTPEEPLHGRIFAIRDAILAGQPDETLKCLGFIVVELINKPSDYRFAITATSSKLS